MHNVSTYKYLLLWFLFRDDGKQVDSTMASMSLASQSSQPQETNGSCILSLRLCIMM